MDLLPSLVHFFPLPSFSVFHVRPLFPVLLCLYISVPVSASLTHTLSFAIPHCSKAFFSYLLRFYIAFFFSSFNPSLLSPSPLASSPTFPFLLPSFPLTFHQFTVLLYSFVPYFSSSRAHFPLPTSHLPPHTHLRSAHTHLRPRSARLFVHVVAHAASLIHKLCG